MNKAQHSLTLNNISVQVPDKILLDAVNLTINPGELVVVLGPNGAGKSTLMKTITGDKMPATGWVMLNGKKQWQPVDKALMVGVLPQSSSLSFPYTVEEVVLLGRTPSSCSRQHNVSVMHQALKKVDCEHLQDQLYTTLSGGEKQRVHLARVLAQIWDESPIGPRYLLLDEPTSALDPAHQQHTLHVAREQADSGLGVFIILHDLNLAAQFADRIMILNQGKVAAEGRPYDVLTPDILRSVFKVEMKVLDHPLRKCPLIITA